jgi:putative aldouronate transport system permease protein
MSLQNKIKSFDIFNYIILSVFCLTVLYPCWYILCVSVSDPEYIVKMKVNIIPLGFNLNAYKAVFASNYVLRAYYNTIEYAFISVICSLLITSITAYPLSLKRFFGRKYVVKLLVISMFLVKGLIPTFIIIQGLGLYNTIWAFILPSAFSVWNIVIMRTYLQQLPDSLHESAYIDGANDWIILFKIYLPLAKPIIAVLCLYAAVGMWNSFFGPLIYLSDEEKLPLAVILRKVLAMQTAGQAMGKFIQGTALEGPAGYQKGFITAVKMSTIMVTIGPIVLLYPFLQKYFIKGVLIGSIKG